MSRTDPPAAGRHDDRAPAQQVHGHGPGHHHYSAEELHNEDVAHEESDVNVRTILLFAAGLAVVTMFAAALMYGLFIVFERQAEARDRVPSPLAVPQTDMPRTTTASPTFGAAPQPQLLTNEPSYLEMQRRTESERLHGYGWIDQQAGLARIPIDEAKKRPLERGLPARAAAADAQLGTHVQAYGEANGGRTIPREAAASPVPAAETPKVTEGAAHKGGV